MECCSPKPGGDSHPRAWRSQGPELRQALCCLPACSYVWGWKDSRWQLSHLQRWCRQLKMGYVKDGSDIYMKNRSKTSRCSESSFSRYATIGDTSHHSLLRYHFSWWTAGGQKWCSRGLKGETREGKHYLMKMGKKLTSVVTGQTPNLHNGADWGLQ